MNVEEMTREQLLDVIKAKDAVTFEGVRALIEFQSQQKAGFEMIIAKQQSENAELKTRLGKLEGQVKKMEATLENRKS